LKGEGGEMENVNNVEVVDEGRINKEVFKQY